MLGDNVNLGSRIEGLTKFYGARLVVGETTREGQDDFVFRRLDLVKVKGKTEGVTVYEPQCRAENATPELLAELEEHERGLSAYYNQDWNEARNIFNALQQQHPEARIYQLYLERISELEQDPPGADWDGVYVRTEK